MSLLLIAALTLFNEAGSFPWQLPSAFSNPLDEDEAGKIFCIEKESIEERIEEDQHDHWHHDSGGSGDATYAQGWPAIGYPSPLHSFYDSVFQSITDHHATHLLCALVGRPFYILFHTFKAFLL